MQLLNPTLLSLLPLVSAIPATIPFQIPNTCGSHNGKYDLVVTLRECRGNCLPTVQESLTRCLENGGNGILYGRYTFLANKPNVVSLFFLSFCMGFRERIKDSSRRL